MNNRYKFTGNRYKFTDLWSLLDEVRDTDKWYRKRVLEDYHRVPDGPLVGDDYIALATGDCDYATCLPRDGYDHHPWDGTAESIVELARLCVAKHPHVKSIYLQAMVHGLDASGEVEQWAAETWTITVWER